MGKWRRKGGKTDRKFWGILGALWLVMVCLAGCGMPAEEAGNYEKESQGVWTAEELTAGETAEADPQPEKPEEDPQPERPEEREPETEEIPESGETLGDNSSKDEVALFLHLYGRLPDNYITKREAEELGWDSKKGNLWEVAPGMSIGGSRFGNYEGALPDKEGREYFECDIDYEGGYRGPKRLIYSNDGLIFYTEDHYNTFEQLYGEE